jgi:hypothetical protein
VRTWYLTKAHTRPTALSRGWRAVMVALVIP